MRVASASRDGEVRKWDAERVKAIDKPLLGPSQEPVSLLAYQDADEAVVLVSADPDGNVVAWDGRTGLKRQRWRVCSQKDTLLDIAGVSVPRNDGGVRLLASSLLFGVRMWGTRGSADRCCSARGKRLVSAAVFACVHSAERPGNPPVCWDPRRMCVCGTARQGCRRHN